MEVDDKWGLALEHARDLVVAVEVERKDGQFALWSALAVPQDVVVVLAAAFNGSTLESLFHPTIVRDGRTFKSEVNSWSATEPTAAYGVPGLGTQVGHRWRSSSTLMAGEELLLVGCDGDSLEAAPGRVTKILPPGTLDGDWDGGTIVCDVGEAETYSGDVAFDMAGSIVGLVTTRVPGTGIRKLLPAEYVFGEGKRASE